MAEPTSNKPENSKVDPAKPAQKPEEEEEKKKKVEVPLFVHRVHIQNKFTFGKITLREYDNIDSINGSALFQGFPNATSDNVVTGIISCSYLVEHLNLPLVGDLVSPNFPPMAIVKRGIPASGARIYGNKHICIFASEYTIKDAEIQYDLVRATIDFAERHKCTMVLCIDAVSGNLSEPTSLLEQIQMSAEEAEDGDEYDDEHDGDDDSGEEDSYLVSHSADAVGVTASADVVGMQAIQMAPAVMMPKSGSSQAAHTSNKDVKKKKEMVKALQEKKKDNKKDDDKKKKSDDSHEKKKGDERKKKEEKDEEDEEEKAKESDIWFITNNQRFAEMLKSFNMEPCVELAMSGVQGGLLNEARFIDMPVVLLLASLDHLSLGARPALGLLQAVEKLVTKADNIDLGLDISNLEESTASLEAKINEVMKKMQQGPPKEESKMNMLYL